MLKETWEGTGKDCYRNNTFCLEEWSAPSMISPAEIKEHLSKFQLEGRKIKSMRLIGCSYFHIKEEIEDFAYYSMEGIGEEERQRRSEFDHIEPTLRFKRNALIDEPFLVKFDDGAQLEFTTHQVPEFQISMNCIPQQIRYGINAPTVDAEILFAPCIGQTIKEVEVNTFFTDKDPMLGDELKEGACELVSDIVLRFESGMGLRFGGWLDYCHVECLMPDNSPALLPFEELKPALLQQEHYTK